MKYLETKHERNAARITTLISIILLLLLFVVGPQYLDPPEEYGVAVNFGTTDFGSSNRPLSKPRKAIKEQIEESQPETPKVEPTNSQTKTEEIITEENTEEIAIKKQKEAEARAKAEAERVERQKREAEERKRREEEEKRKKLDDLIGGVTNSNDPDDDGAGSDNKSGNSGNGTEEKKDGYGEGGNEEQNAELFKIYQRQQQLRQALEDKIVKYFFKSLSEKRSISRYVPKIDQPDTLFKMIEKKPILPSKNELKENLPSRSAKLRYVIKKNNFYDFETDIKEKFDYLLKIENLGDKL